MSSFLQLRGIEKSFGAQRALCGIDLDLGEDELLVVLGPTGAGKTTLLRVIAGLETPDGGQLHMAGEEVGHWDPASRDVAFAFQNFALYPDWTVRRNLEFPLRAPGRQLGEGEIAERIAWAADLLHIDKLLDRPSVQLSGGEMQRVAIGRCIVRRPRLFLLDEPLTNLDAKLRESLRVELALLRRSLAIPMVYVTHDQAEALSMADRIAVLSEGTMLQVGTPESVYRNPSSPQVARQLGQPAINVFEVCSRGGQWWVEGGGSIGSTRAAEGTVSTIGIRPEDIAPHGGSGGGIVRAVEDAGSTWVLRVDWLGQSVHITADKERDYTPGTDIAPKVRTERIVEWRGGVLRET
jgi:multiple sugar transport system ATP-binding protein